MSIGDFQNEETVKERLAKDINYIKRDIITQIKDNKDDYCKFSKPLNAITVLSFTKNSYIRYWTQSYMRHPKEKQQIIDVCNEKFKNGLTPKQTMINLVEKSRDTTSDKTFILCALKGLPVPKQPTKQQLKKEAQINAYFTQIEQYNKQDKEISIEEYFRKNKRN